MYTPNHFRQDDREALHLLMRRNSFALLISTEAGGPQLSHLPLLIDTSHGRWGMLIGHMARANSHWRMFDGRRMASAVFTGPHAYVSPSWYEGELNVPTWNYAVVHAHGAPRVVEEEAARRAIMRRLVDFYEAAFDRPWRFELPEDYTRRMLDGIVVFEMPIDRLEGKFKLSQNRTAADQRRVSDQLARSSDPLEREVAALMAPRDGQG